MGWPIWDDQPTRAELQHHHVHHHRHQARTISRSRTVRTQHNRSHDPATDTTPSSSNSRPDTETEDDACGDPDSDGDIDMSHDQETDPPRHHQHRQPDFIDQLVWCSSLNGPIHLLRRHSATELTERPPGQPFTTTTIRANPWSLRCLLKRTHVGRHAVSRRCVIREALDTWREVRVLEEVNRPPFPLTYR